ncbi:phospholipase A [Salinimicrobium sp. GXAS 041]|uniref:phospholipase A n=1 Tax=Salinimicrobium sp. GXAS 041 TaxID=3400806 RepID=UPI003C788F61
MRISLLFLFFTAFFCSNSFSQQLFREQVDDTISKMPSFSMYEDNYMVTGVPLNKEINKGSADIKYQISFKQLLTRKTLPLDSYLFLTYTQTAFWNVYAASSPFAEINFNPGISLGKPVYNSKERLIGMAFLNAQHESNGRDSIYSRSWNKIAISFHARISDRINMSLEGWYPVRYKKDNPDLMEYLGPGELNFSYNLEPKNLALELMLRKGLNWEWKGAVKMRLLYRPFEMRTHRLTLEWFHGYGESLINYNNLSSMIRIGFLFRSDDLNFLKPAPNQI